MIFFYNTAAASTTTGIFIFLLGLIFGSFFNVCIFRIPDERSLGGRSHCHHCRKKLPWYWNIPLISFVLLQAKTRCCRKTIPLQYPLVELAGGAVFLSLYLAFGIGWHWVCYCILFSALLVISVIDLHHQIIPDEISLPGIPLGVVASFLTQDITWYSSLMGIFLGGGTFFAIAYLYEAYSGQEGLGGGDVKLLAMLGAWFGIESVLILVIFSTLLGTIVALFLMAFRNASTKTAIPFGPFLAIAAVVYLAFRSALLPYFYPLFFS